MSTGAIEGGRTGRHRVWLAELRAYDPAAIRQAVDEGMAALGVRPEGRLVAVADWTLALPGLADAAATRPEFIAGVLDSLMEADPRALTVLTGASAGPSTR